MADHEGRAVSAAAGCLGADSRLARSLPGFAPREAQQRMAAAVEAALADGHDLVVEAGTGTGKTYAYLVPALLSAKRVVIATGTRTLQDQLVHRDLPRLREVIDVPARVALLKGRGNYLCIHRLKRARAQVQYAQHWPRLQTIDAWMRRSESGDLAELAELGGEPREADPLVRLITSTADNCLGARCDDFEQCFVARARRRAQAADVVVINHHLLFADFLLKENGFGQVLGGADAVIVDEAHQLPELASRFFGQRVSTAQLAELARDAELEARGSSAVETVAAAAQRLVGDLARLETQFIAPGQRIALSQFLRNDAVRAELARVGEALHALYALLAPLEERNAEWAALVERGVQLRDHWRAIAEPGADDADAESTTPAESVRWVEGLLRGGTLNATPIDLAPGFERMRALHDGAWVYTSATLASGDDFSHFLTALGLRDAHCERYDSPFDFARQARLYLPQGMPEPNAGDYFDAVVEKILPLIEASGGGAFVLCTSHRAVRILGPALRGRLSLQLLQQGDDSRSALLDRFVEDGNAVLVGTSSFWEGVDVRGQALRIVIVDRLPFAVPGDPVFEARLNAVRATGASPFDTVQLPQAIVALRQGIGRLIRDPADRGLAVICDPRLRGKSYGRRMLAALPPMPVLTDAEAARAWASGLDR